MNLVCIVKLLITITALLIGFSSFAQEGTGLEQQFQVVSQNTVNTVPFALVYVEELNQEFMADEFGTLSLNLEKGEYHLYVSSLGFEESVFELNVTTASFTPLQLASNVVVATEVITSQK